ncbi:MAG: efflux RND transporter periplasmic adaptor subunit [Gammaproteobacteria bacterium]|nr:efflux RND transporter periplasmic adaptor subunit [Gammaproteobacteria bacterium]
MKTYLLPILLLLLVGCDQTQRAASRTPAPTPVEVATVSRSPLIAHRILTGSLQAVTTVHIFNEEEGRIVELPFYEGDAVEKDAILARIDDRLIQAELNKTEATLKQAKVDVKRLDSLYRKKLASEDELARAQTALDLARAEVSLLQTRMAHTRIKAPFSGIISERLKETGDVVPVHSHILTLFDPAQIKIVIPVSELLFSNINTGDTVEVRIDALGEQQYPATVKRIFPTIDPQTRKGMMEMQFATIPDGARPGQLCRVTVNTQTTPRRNVPFAAIRHDSQGEFVYRLTANNTVESVRVQTGILLGNQMEILEGVEVNDRVVVKGFIGLRDGKKVVPVNTKPAAVDSTD